jgi:hypothetical protein
MLFQVLKYEGSAFGSNSEVVFHSPRDATLLVLSFASFSLGTLCFFTGEPRNVAELLAFVFFGVAAIVLFFAGLAAEVVFRRDARQMEVRWAPFGRELIAHPHPYSSIRVTIHFYQAFPTRGSTARSQSAYLAEVGLARFVLTYPPYIPGTDDQLKVVRRDLGFSGETGEAAQQPTNDPVSA